MKILLDEDIPKSLKNYLPGHSAIHVLDLGWEGIKDSVFPTLLGDEWDVFVTADKNLRFQQNLKRWIALSHIQRGDCIEIPFHK